MSRRRPTEAAFTLIELLVVMIIIAILMAVAIPTFLAQKNTAVKSKTTQNIKQILNAIETCSARNATEGASYANCLDHNALWQDEPALKPLVRLGGGDRAVATTPGGYDIDAIDASGRIVNTPVADTTYSGFVIATWIRDAETSVWFTEAHTNDGTVIRACGPGNSDAGSPGGGVPHPGAKVPGSKTCATGKWG